MALHTALRSATLQNFPNARISIIRGDEGGMAWNDPEIGNWSSQRFPDMQRSVNGLHLSTPLNYNDRIKMGRTEGYLPFLISL